MKMLNVGAGAHCHDSWVNIDLVPIAPGVIQHDLRQGLPFEDDCMDAVYHSHVIEHLTEEDGQKLLGECYRVLRPGGILRVAAPDLEGIARAYLKAIDRFRENQPGAGHDLEWMRLELFDQMTRCQSGGAMKQWMQGPQIPNREFVAGRVGLEAFGPSAKNSHTTQAAATSKRPSSVARWGRKLTRLKRRVAHFALKTLLGAEATTALTEGEFRQSGEIHRWMYDSVSMAQTLEALGFEDAVAVGGAESRISNFASYQLDVVDGEVRKPDSLFMEAVKPRIGGLGIVRAAG